MDRMGTGGIRRNPSESEYRIERDPIVICNLGVSGPHLVLTPLSGARWGRELERRLLAVRLPRLPLHVLGRSDEGVRWTV